MSLSPDYVDADTVKDYLRIDGDDTVDDLVIAAAITAASRAVDHATNRQFGVETTAVARVHDIPARRAGRVTGPFAGRVAVELDIDLMSTTDLAVATAPTAGGTFDDTITEFDLWPWNATADGKPWTHIVFDSDVTVPTGPRRLQITALWGWAAVPAAVEQACLFQINRWYKRRDAAFGVAGSPDLGSELRLLAKLDPDVAVLVAQLRRPWAAA